MPASVLLAKGDHWYDGQTWLRFCASHLKDGASLVLQPFTVFGVLAIAESQDRYLRSTNRKAKRSKSESFQHSTRVMNTSNLKSVITLCGRTKKPIYRMAKCILLNTLIEKISGIPEINLSFDNDQKLSSSLLIWTFAYKAAVSVAMAPLRLLSTEIIVFQRFDWRSLQLNTRIIPIFVPNLLLGITGMLRLLSFRVIAKFMRKASHTLSTGTLTRSLGLPVLGIIVSAVACSGLICAEILIEIIRVRTDLLVLNGDSAHSILPLDESYEGGMVQAAVGVPDYDVMDTAFRYAKLCTLPSVIVLGALSSLKLSFEEGSKHWLRAG